MADTAFHSFLIVPPSHIIFRTPFDWMGNGRGLGKSDTAKGLRWINEQAGQGLCSGMRRRTRGGGREEEDEERTED